MLCNSVEEGMYAVKRSCRVEYWILFSPKQIGWKIRRVWVDPWANRTGRVEAYL